MYVRLTPTTRGKFGTQIRLYLASTVFSPSFTSHLLQQKSHLFTILFCHGASMVADEAPPGTGPLPCSFSTGERPLPCTSSVGQRPTAAPPLLPLPTSRRRGRRGVAAHSDSLPLPIGARAAPPFASWSSATLRVAHASSNTGTAAPPWSIQAIRHGQAWLRQRPSSSTVDSSSVGADSTPHAPIRLHRHRFKLHWC
jgi:hypothetical protein